MTAPDPAIRVSPAERAEIRPRAIRMTREGIEEALTINARKPRANVWLLPIALKDLRAAYDDLADRDATIARQAEEIARLKREAAGAWIAGRDQALKCCRDLAAWSNPIEIAEVIRRLTPPASTQPADPPAAVVPASTKEPSDGL